MDTFDWLEEISGCFQAGVCAVVTFGGEAHGGAVRTAGVGFLVVAELLVSVLVQDGEVLKTCVPLQCHANRTITGP